MYFLIYGIRMLNIMVAYNVQHTLKVTLLFLGFNLTFGVYIQSNRSSTI